MSIDQAMPNGKPAPMGFTLFQQPRPADTFSWGDWMRPPKTEGEQVRVYVYMAMLFLSAMLAIALPDPSAFLMGLIAIGIVLSACFDIGDLRATICRGKCDANGVFLTSRKKDRMLGDYRVSEHIYSWNEISKIEEIEEDDGEGGKTFAVRLTFSTRLPNSDTSVTQALPSKNQAASAVRTLVALQTTAATP
jgi:hypothetical protein